MYVIDTHNNTFIYNMLKSITQFSICFLIQLFSGIATLLSLSSQYDVKKLISSHCLYIMCIQETRFHDRYLPFDKNFNIHYKNCTHNLIASAA